MTNEVNEILYDLYLDNITIDDACKSLNKTRREIWDLLDAFEYIPTSEDVIIACKIEHESMKIIENRADAVRKISDFENKNQDMFKTASSMLSAIFGTIKIKNF